MSDRRHRTRAERQASQARFDAMTAAETARRRADAQALIDSETPQQRAERAAAAIAKYGGPA